MQTSAMRNYELPANGSSLLSHKVLGVQYLNNLAYNKCIRINKTDLPQDIEFAEDPGVKPSVAFAELLRIGLAHGKKVNDIATEWGFDSKALPDAGYLLKAVYIWDKESPLIRALPRTAPELNADMTEFEAQKMDALIENLRKGAKIKKDKGTMDKQILDQHVPELQSIFMSYTVGKFEKALFADQTREVIMSSQNNPYVAQIMRETGLDKLARVEALGINTGITKKLLEKPQHHGPGMEIEHNQLRQPGAAPNFPGYVPPKNPTAPQRPDNRDEAYPPPSPHPEQRQDGQDKRERPRGQQPKNDRRERVFKDT